VAANEFAVTGAGQHPKVEQKIIAFPAAVTQFRA
jgi:hypothetical protein